MEERLEKAQLLIDRERPEEALELLASVLANDPENYRALYHQSRALAELERWKLALQSALQLVAAAPDWNWSHHQVGDIYDDINKEKKALPFVKEAIRLDPEEPDHFGLLASCYAGLSNWKRMLEATEKGLELDPEHAGCILLRSHALRLLKRGDEAGSAIERLGKLAPNEPSVHISLGWLRLQEGKPSEAMDHFREALRLDPDDPNAREGLAEALKGQNVLYRPILAWYMLSARLGQKGSIVLILSIWFGMQFVDDIPGPRWIPIALLVLYFLFVWLSWVGSGLFDLLLYLRRDLRDILAKRERTGAKFLGISLLCGCLFAGVVLSHGAEVTAAAILGAFFLVGIPIAGAVNMRNTKSRTISGIIAVAAFLCALAGTVPIMIDPYENPDSFIPLHDQAAQLINISLLISLFSTLAITGLGFVPEDHEKR